LLLQVSETEALRLHAADDGYARSPFSPSLDVFSVTALPASIGAGASESRTWDLDGPTPQV
jgi:hypothetical protein